MELIRHNFSTRQVNSPDGTNAWRERIIAMNYQLEFRSNPRRSYRASFKRYFTPNYQLVAFTGERAEYIREQRHVDADKLNDFEFFAVHRGNCTIEQFGASATCAAGSIFLVDASAPLFFGHCDAFSGAIFKVPRHLVEEQLSDLDLICGRPIVCASGVPRISFDLLTAIQREGLTLDFGAFEDVCRKLLDLFCATVGAGLAHADGATASTALVASRARRYIRNHIAQANLRTEDVARAAGVSVRYLQKLFQDRGATVQGYIQAQRLDHARRLLTAAATKSWPITKIAFESGFGSGAYFSTAFKKAYGLSPSEYRALARTDDTRAVSAK